MLAAGLTVYSLLALVTHCGSCSLLGGYSLVIWSCVSFVLVVVSAVIVPVPLFTADATEPCGNVRPRNPLLALRLILP